MAQDRDVSPEWQAILDEANGQTVNWFMWGGSDDHQLATSATGWARRPPSWASRINQVPSTDTVDAVNKVLGEKQAGKRRGRLGGPDLDQRRELHDREAGRLLVLRLDRVAARTTSTSTGTSAAILNDFGTPVDGCESPWSHAPVRVHLRLARRADPPSTMDELLAVDQGQPRPVHLSGHRRTSRVRSSSATCSTTSPAATTASLASSTRPSSTRSRRRCGRLLNEIEPASGAAGHDVPTDEHGPRPPLRERRGRDDHDLRPGRGRRLRRGRHLPELIAPVRVR